MVNALKLKGKIIERGCNIEKVAKQLGMNKSTFYKRLKTPDCFTIIEAERLASFLCLSPQEASDIFFADNVDYKQL